MDWLIHVFLLMTATKTADASDGRSSICNTKNSTRFVVQMDDYNENRIGGEYWVDKDLITLRCNAPSKPSGQVHWMELKSRSWGPAARPGNDTLVLPQTSGAHIAKEAARYVCLVWSSDVKELATSNVITIRYPYMDKNIVNQCSSDGCANCSYPTIPDKLLQNRVSWTGNAFIQSNMTSDKMQLCINPSDFSAFGYATCKINVQELWPSARYGSDVVLFEYKFSALENCSAKSPSQPSPLPAADYIANFEVCDERIVNGLTVDKALLRLLGEGDSYCYDNQGNVYQQNMSYDIGALVGSNQTMQFLCCDLTTNPERGYECRQTPVTFPDVDECTVNTDNCSPDAVCTNTEGSFSCACYEGFSGNGIDCKDVDECTVKTGNCSPDAVCTNTEGSFSCACYEGFSGNGTDCKDVDECTVKTDNCSSDANCTNTEGSFSCACYEGFSGNGTDCKGPPSMVGIVFGIIIGLLVAVAGLYLLLKAYNNKKKMKIGTMQQ